MVKYPKYVYLGENVRIEENVRLGVGREELGDLVIGDNSIIRSGTVIYRGTTIGNYFNSGHNALIREKNKIGNGVSIGSNAVLEPGNEIGDYSRIHSLCFLENAVIGDYVFVGPSVKILDDNLPIDPNPKNYKGAIISDDVAIGGGSVLLPHITIDCQVLVGAGSVVTRDIPSGEVWAGNPIRYIKKTSELRYHGTDVPYLPGTRRRHNLIKRSRN
jgi:acetyltransferase-like isoleucine patch superfamily enzyme